MEDWKELTRKMLGLQFTCQEQIEFCKFMQETQDHGRRILRTDDFKADYLKQELSRVADVNSIFPDTVIPDLVKSYYKQIVSDRDSSLAESMRTHVDTGNAFIAIGFSHLKGVVEELRIAGYTVNPRMISERKVLIPESIEEC